jgi:hypothetical protein
VRDLSIALAQVSSPEAWAHGHRLYLVPVGNALGLVAVLALATFTPLRWGSRVAGVAVAALAGYLASLALPTTAGWFLTSGAGSFLVGFLPPVVAGGGLLWWRRAVDRRDSGPRG